jgi:hypothetical protein
LFGGLVPADALVLFGRWMFCVCPDFPDFLARGLVSKWGASLHEVSSRFFREIAGAPSAFTPGTCTLAGLLRL